MLAYICFIILFAISSIKDTEHHVIKHHQVIVSLTTSPIRIAKIKPVIDSIMQQTLVPDRIVVNLPHVFKRYNSTFDEIPIFLTNNPKITINRCEDIGSLTKVLPTLELASSMDDIIISIDDDIDYPNDIVEHLLTASQLFPDCVISASAVHNYKDNFHALLEGWCGTLYKKKFLTNFDQTEIKEYPRECFLGDDLILSNYLAKQKIHIVGLELSQIFWDEKRLLPYWDGEDALYNSHENDNFYGHDYRACINYLKSKNDYHMDPGFENLVK